METKVNPIAAFLKAAHGNWRNSIFVKCGGCKYGRQEPCSGFLLAFDAAARPVIIRIEQVSDAFGEIPQYDECAAQISGTIFEQLFASWLVWAADSPRECALCKISESGYKVP